MNNKFNIGDKVYHITTDSPQGTILDVVYYFRGDNYTYLVAWGHDYNSTVWEEELSKDKVINTTGGVGFGNK